MGRRGTSGGLGHVTLLSETGPSRVNDVPVATTRARYALLIAIPLLAASFAGALMFYPLFGTDYGAALSACQQQSAAVEDPIAQASQFFDCAASVERGRVSFALGVGALAMIAGLGLLRWLPTRLYNRLGRVRRAGERWQLAAAEAVRSMGGSAVPEVVIATNCHEAFSVRVRGRVRIVLPRGIVSLPDDEAAAVLRHECAHVVAGDVGRVWLTRGVWWATPVILAVPVVDEIVRAVVAPDKSVGGELWDPFWLAYSIRSVLLLLLVWGVSRGVLRAREHDADLLAASDGVSGSALRRVLLRGGASPGRVARFVALHPSTAQRFAVLDQGGTGRRTLGMEGFAFGALTGSVLLLTSFFVRPLFMGIETPELAALAAALIPGALLGLAWGTTVAHATATAGPLSWQVVVGMPVGALLGLALAPTSDWRPWEEMSYSAWLWGLAALLLPGAAVLSAAIGAHVLSPNATRSARITTTLVVIALFTGAIALIEQTATMTQFGGWREVLQVLSATSSWALVVGQVALVVVGWRRSRGAGVAALATSAGIAVVVIAGRLVLAAPLTLENAKGQIATDVLLAAAAGAVCFLVVVATVAAARLAVAVAAGWTTTVLVTVALTLRFPFYPDEIWWYYTQPALSLLAAGLLALAVVVASLHKGEWQSVPPRPAG